MLKTDTRLAKYQQATTQDYTRSGFDRGILWRMTLLLILRLTL